MPLPEPGARNTQQQDIRNLRARPRPNIGELDLHQASDQIAAEVAPVESLDMVGQNDASWLALDTHLESVPHLARVTGQHGTSPIRI